ncbi:NAC domain-containing protein 104-like [Populus alba x Populus x berolinensis]|uniref:NAC domain-containing protein n=2 Tax=Populus TaxID=3689 RepID=A0A4U5NB03_POPAL|nr:NAC domain-containing protein 104-like [Populus alba]KAG6775309.1 hypothetical protein POTOM_018753 [Populus tomentosa]KAJ6929172.1 NAC domain-containing protein 104-like [Populus alba x Populus x berolinensis]TKR79271.1 hypothetical protein D5086_0000273300 [Populus alba]WQE73172.1 NAC17 [Populus davidiana x Populus alba var. pyramidalis]
MGDHGCSGNLPPGFIFSPSDEELILHFLDRKASLLPCHPDIIPDLGLYPQDPWQLEGRALSSENQWYYFSRVMENQATGNGFWKPLDTEEPIFSSSAGKKVGLKKYLVYCIGPEGVETNWMMQEYHLCSGKSNGKSYKRKQKLDCSKWILCRVYQREGSCSRSLNHSSDDDGTELSCLDEMFLSMDDLDDISFPN